MIFTTKQQNKLTKEFNSFCSANEIYPQIIFYSNSSRAFYHTKDETKVIQVPGIRTSVHTGMCLHAAGHILLGHCLLEKRGLLKDKRDPFIHELEALEFAIMGLKALDIPHDEYETEAKNLLSDNAPNILA